MKRNKKLLNQIADVIEKYPEMHNQNFWGLGDLETHGESDINDSVFLSEVQFLDNRTIESEGQQYHCGTKHCVAGWAVVLSNIEIPHEKVEHGSFIREDGKRLELTHVIGKSLLGLSARESSNLFNNTKEDDELHFLSSDNQTVSFENWPEYIRHIANGGEIYGDF